jgi:hypothetical protein
MKNKKSLFLLLVTDLVLVILYWYYQPLCEPCLDRQDCPPCISREQYFTIYFGVAINLIFGLYYFYTNRKQKSNKATK